MAECEGVDATSPPYFSGANRSDHGPVLGKAPKRHRCSFCHYSSDYMAHVKMHMRIHTGEKPYVCQVCFRRFSQKAALGRHSKAIHEGQRNYLCSVCANHSHRNPALATNESPGKHQRVKKEEGGHHCRFCNYSSDHAADVKIHEKLHTGKKSYVCQVCFMGFTKKSNLSRHSQAVHEDQRSHVCLICGSGFKREQHLQRHKRLHFK
ncbi:zinc finger protein 70-like [Ornithodoros turicata]|uniref:zinc finger protein 70-like n=1 Tax=Ornithodoros turicata TaxID=34597 RepID=UPI00313A0A58